MLFVIYIIKIDLLFVRFGRLDEATIETKNDVKYLHFFNDKSCVYTSFFADFGPFDLGLTYKFCIKLQNVMNKAQKESKIILFHINEHPHQKTNSIVLLLAYLV